MYVTGLLPLTGMFETVVFVAFCVALLAVWFALLPILRPGLESAWRLSGREAGFRESRGRRLRSGLLALLFGMLIVLVFIALARGEWRDKLVLQIGWHGNGLFDLLPHACWGRGAIGHIAIVWLLGMCLLLATV